ncbi:hypothetical protein VTJ04DRAFT_4858 [Mycothermus thermophilus]|uniref:uncharacterized protein n=1 Tax=Humicola insolens TaxID=85995 RepID=UPI003742899B
MVKIRQIFSVPFHSRRRRKGADWELEPSNTNKTNATVDNLLRLEDINHALSKHDELLTQNSKQINDNEQRVTELNRRLNAWLLSPDLSANFEKSWRLRMDVALLCNENVKLLDENYRLRKSKERLIELQETRLNSRIQASYVNNSNDSTPTNEEGYARRRRPHAIDTLPILDYFRRPVTPIQPDPQLSSSFFRLPAEIRVIIYRLVLSPRGREGEIHMDIRYTAAVMAPGEPHSTRDTTLSHDGRRWTWCASHCHRSPTAQHISDRCALGGPPPTACSMFTSDEGIASPPCAIGPEVHGLLRACRLTYHEALPILYGENTFHISSGAAVWYGNRLVSEAGRECMTRLVLKVTEELAWFYAEEHLKLSCGWAVYRSLLDAVPRYFPNLAWWMVLIPGALISPPALMPAIPTAQPNVAIRDALLHSMDRAMAKFERPLNEAILVMHNEPFERLMQHDAEQAERVETRPRQWRQFWRTLPVDEDQPSGEPKGYWIRGVAEEEYRFTRAGLNFITTPESI